jgi:hypothetical protein
MEISKYMTKEAFGQSWFGPPLTPLVHQCLGRAPTHHWSTSARVTELNISALIMATVCYQFDFESLISLSLSTVSARMQP